MYSKLKLKLKRGRAIALGLCASLLLAFGASAGTLNLSNVPLFLSSGADPNIMLLFDDATSMDFQMAADVSLLNTGTSKYPEVDQGEPIGLQCSFSLAALLTDVLTLNVLDLTVQVQNLVQCIVGTKVENANGLLQAPENIINGLCTAEQNNLNNAINANNQVAITLNQTLLTTCIVTGLVSNTISLNLLNPPQYHYAYLNDTDDNYFANSASDYTNGFLPVMLDEAYIPPSTNVDGITGANPNYRPPALSTYNCVPLLGNNCVGLLSSWNDPPRRATGTSGSADARNVCQYPPYSLKGALSTYTGTTAPANTASPGYWRAWNYQYNPIAYNPNVTYKPWKGYDSAGNPFTDANPTAVRYDPLNPSDTYNITVPQRHRGAVAYRCGVDIFQSILTGDILNGVTNTTTIKQLTAVPPVTVPAYTGSYPPANLTEAAAWNNTYVPAHNRYGVTWLSLYPARYFEWNRDNNGNGLVDSWETHKLIEIRPSGTCGFGATCPTSFARPATRTDCPGGTCTATQELQNYANWFQYYRRRELVAKAAYANVIANKTGARMGFAVLVKNANTKVPGPLGAPSNSNTLAGDPTAVTGNYAVQRKIEPLDPDYTISGTNYAALGTVNTKRDLLDHLVRTNSGGGATAFFGLTKPLRSALDNVGQYIECNTAGNPYGFTHTETGAGLTAVANTCPMLNQANGGTCQQNYTVVATDGFWDAADAFNNAGNADGDRNTAYDGGAYRDTQSNTLGDIAMKYYENDLATALPNNEPVLLGVDEARHQHMVTFAVAFGLNGALSSNPANPTMNFTWPNPYNSDEAKIDDLRHAAYNGRGQFIAANDSTSLESALTRIFTDITARSSSASSVALNSGSLNIGTTVFQARFDSAAWTGQLLAFAISPGPGFSRPPCVNEPKGQKCTPALWEAGAVLATQNWDTGRSIITFNSQTKAGVPFRWGNISVAQQQSLLNVDPTTNATDANGQKRLNYVRGYDGLPADNFRTRTTPLGDIIDSDPFFVEAPRAPYDGEDGYTDFSNAHQDRTGMIYVGANDGMLHGFRASDGREMMAFVPGDLNIYKNLPLLSAQNYKGNHRFFADGSATVNDAYFTAAGTTAWRTALVSGLRLGGQSVFALDVTNPSSFSEGSAADTVLWQFSDADDSDLGYTFSRPNIIKMHNGKWAAIIGNGYNSNESDGHTGSGEACLFILFMNGPTAGTWNNGTEYKKICVVSGGPDNSARPNGLASPGAVDLDGDNLIDDIYAGDLEGNMWRFDVSSSSVGSWGVAYSGKPLFTACTAACTDTNRQPITSRPEVGAPPASHSEENGVLVYFGTGKYFESGDDNPNAQPTQTFYMVYDQMWGTATATPASPPTLPFQRDSLVQQQITQESSSGGGPCASDANCFRVTTENQVTLTPIDGTPTDQGWYLDLVNTQDGNTNNQGERVVSDSILREDRIVFTTLIPLQDICSFGGKGQLMELGYDSGKRLDTPPWDLNGDGVINNADTIGGVVPSGMSSPVGIIPKPAIIRDPQKKECLEYKYVPGTTGDLLTIPESCSTPAGRKTWRQIR